MRCLAALSSETAVRLKASGKQVLSDITAIELAGVTAHVGLIHQEDLTFNPDAKQNENKVFIRVKAFSCNYREQTRVLQSTTLQSSGYIVLGSEFVGEVLAVGKKVTSLCPGQRVIGNGGVDLGLSQPGLTTQRASAELQIFHQDKVIAIDDSMSDEVAASFSIGAQTGYSMVNRLPCQAGEHVLVTAATSNTSLFVIRGLLRRGVVVHALTTNPRIITHLESIGVDHVCLINRQGDFARQMKDYFSELNICEFDHVVDPFMDVYLRKLIKFTRRFGSYMTCGVAQQSGAMELDEFSNQGLFTHELFSLLLRKSITLIGNNLGLASDLQHAISDHQQGHLSVDIDTIYEDGDKVPEFIQRSFLQSGRQGKVVYRYS